MVVPGDTPWKARPSASITGVATPGSSQMALPAGHWMVPVAQTETDRPTFTCSGWGWSWAAPGAGVRANRAAAVQRWRMGRSIALPAGAVTVAGTRPGRGEHWESGTVSAYAWAVTRRLPLPLLLALVACGGGSSGSFPPPVVYDEPRVAPVSCPTAPVLVNGGANPRPDPGSCLRAVQPSALPAVSATVPHGWLDLGVHTVGTVVPFTVPAGTASLTIVEQVVSAAERVTAHFPTSGGTVTATQDNAAVVAELRDPAGRVVFTDIRLDGPADGSTTPLFFASYSPVTGTLTYPNTTAALAAASGGVAPGRWTVQVGDFAYECALAGGTNPPPALAGFSCDPALAGETPFAEGSYRLYLLTRPAAPSGAAIPASGALDVTFHIVDAPAPGLIAIGAAQAPTSATVRRMVESYAALMANAGLCLGTVTFLDAPDWARTRFGPGVSDADLSPCSEFSQLLTLSVPGQRSLDLFLVTRIGSGGTVAALGIDGTIPGPATVNGTVASGAMVSAESLGAGSCPAAGAPLDLLRCGADEVAYVAAHESGHFLGLYHTSEIFGGQWDPLSSTPKCASSCGGFGVAATSCRTSSGCGGGLNLMFPLLDGTVSRGYLTGEQGQVARASPLVR